MKMSVERRWNDTDRRKEKYAEINVFQYHFFTTNITWTAEGSNAAHRGETPASTRLT
jgi:hypothetical protein